MEIYKNNKNTIRNLWLEMGRFYASKRISAQGDASERKKIREMRI